MRHIEFRSPHFNLKNGKFEGFTYWGHIDEHGNPCERTFTSPNTLGGTRRGDSEEFTSWVDAIGVMIFEGDILTAKDGVTEHQGVVVFRNAGFIWDMGEGQKISRYWPISQDYINKYSLTITQNIHQL